MEKNTIKEHFRNGSRPTQEHFYALIDACYNEENSVYISGYELRTDIGDAVLVKSMLHRAGKTLLVPWFSRINVPHERTFNYSIPCSNMGRGMVLDKIAMEIRLPESKTYEVKDKKGSVLISQKVVFNSLEFYNGTELIMSIEGKNIPLVPIKEFEIRESIGQARSINIDITLDYEIKSNIAISDQFDLTKEHAKELEHLFGGVLCQFKPISP
tara:strand:- start:31160 stop:31798 length:639 start_codon:yes stop_codon:yes gene_type:complete